MRKIRQVLRLHHEEHLSQRKISERSGMSRDAVKDYLVRALSAQLAWPLPNEMDDQALEALLFPINTTNANHANTHPDFAQVHIEMKAKGATLQVVHEEFLASNPAGIRYSQFCDLYGQFTKRLKPSLRRIYTAGERVFVDYSGKTMTVHLSAANVRTAQIFVGVLGASDYIYAEAHWSQQIPDWIAAHTRMYEHFGGVPLITTCDNLKSGVTKACRREPVIQAIYQNLANHYNTTILPARAKKPKDKAKVENSVLIVQRWILFRLRKHIFTSLAELNEAIRLLLIDANARPFKKLAGSRKSLFEQIEAPALKPLPNLAFVYAEFRKVRVNTDYHVEVDGLFYSVPNELTRKEVELRLTVNIVEVLYHGRRVASHVRIPGQKINTIPDHMTEEHRQFGRWQPNEILAWSADAGESVFAFMQALIKQFHVSDQGYRASLSIKNIAIKYGEKRLNAACLRLLTIGNYQVSDQSFERLRSILKTKLDQVPLDNSEITEASFTHSNIRGSDYYH